MRWGVLVLLSLLLGLLLAACGPEGEPRFVSVDVFAETGEAALAAWQLDCEAHGAQIVGVEGGEGVFAEPPHYDPEALHRGGRIILAALSTASVLPRGRVRVARLHLRQLGDVQITQASSALRAAGPDGRSIQIQVRFVPLSRG